MPIRPRIVDILSIEACEELNDEFLVIEILGNSYNNAALYEVGKGKNLVRKQNE